MEEDLTNLTYATVLNTTGLAANTTYNKTEKSSESYLVIILVFVAVVVVIAFVFIGARILERY